MNFGEQMNWKTWEDIKKWCEKNGFINVVKRIAEDEEDAKEIARGLNKDFAENYGLY